MNNILNNRIKSANFFTATDAARLTEIQARWLHFAKHLRHFNVGHLDGKVASAEAAYTADPSHENFAAVVDATAARHRHVKHLPNVQALVEGAYGAFLRKEFHPFAGDFAKRALVVIEAYSDEVMKEARERSKEWIGTEAAANAVAAATQPIMERLREWAEKDWQGSGTTPRGFFHTLQNTFGIEFEGAAEILAQTPDEAMPESEFQKSWRREKEADKKAALPVTATARAEAEKHAKLVREDEEIRRREAARSKLNRHLDSWTDEQLRASVKGQPIPDDASRADLIAFHLKTAGFAD